MRLFQPILVLATIATSVAAQNATVPPVPPTMTLLYSMRAELGERLSLGPVPNGQQRIVIPIVGGSFKGPRMAGRVLNIGADWLLVDARGNARPDTRYNIQTDDGTYIYVQTQGPTLGDGRILLQGKFETSANGTYAWLNDVVAVGVLTVNGSSEVLIDMWQATP